MANNNENKVLNVPHLRFPEFSGEWAYTSIGNECDILCGYAFDGQDILENDGNVKLLRGINITEGEIRHSLDLDRYYSGDTHKLGKYVLQEGDLVIGMDGSKVGRNSAILTKNEQGTYLVQRVCRIRSQKQNIRFVYQHINNPKFHRYVDSVKTASAIPHISQSDIQNYHISFPPTSDEQNKIARLLSLIDERIVTQNKIIEDLKKLKSAISLKMLHSDSWEQFKIQDIASIGRGRVISSVEISQQENPLYPVYSSQTSNDGIMGYLDDFMFEGEYISWTTDGANAGTVFYRNGKFNCTNVCGLLKLKKGFDAHFVSLVLAEATRMYVSTNLANPKLMNNTMGNIQIRLPKLEEQKRISVVFRKLHGLLETHNSLIIKYSKQKQYLLSQMFI